MVLGVGDWIETNDGTVGMVINVDKMGRASGSIEVHVLGEPEPVEVEVTEVKGPFPG